MAQGRTCINGIFTKFCDNYFFYSTLNRNFYRLLANINRSNFRINRKLSKDINLYLEDNIIFNIKT